MAPDIWSIIRRSRARIDPKAASISIYKDSELYEVVGSLGGHKYITHSLTMSGATKYAREWLYLYLNGEMY